jgi:DNA-binding transcriptional regulator YbjK
MSGIIAELRAFKARKAALEVEARRMVALRLISGVDLSAALTVEPDKAADIIKRVERLIERERLKGLRRHWAYDLNRHIALKQALDQLRQAHGLPVPARPERQQAPWKTKRRRKAPSC